jgi:tetratricopeptide (TPR) repeat protein
MLGENAENKLFANDSKVLVLGWDAADWTIAGPLIEAGKMPNLAKLIAEGTSGSISTITPSLSPMLWTSIATGKRPLKHGIYGFTEPTPDGKNVRPITNASRKTKAIWNILNQVGKKSNVVGWWPSHPAEPISGVMVSNWFQVACKLANEEGPEDGGTNPGPDGWKKDQWQMSPGTVYPTRLENELQQFRFHPAEVTADLIAPFIAEGSNPDWTDPRMGSLAKVLADTVSVNSAATSIMTQEPWDFMAIYFDGIDHFSHGFMKYHPPRQEWVEESDYEVFKNVVEGAYQLHDLMLGTHLELAGDDTTVIILSDHGFNSGNLRPEHIPVEPAGPAMAEHGPYGMFVAKGPGIKKGEKIIGASVLDIAPTILSCFGLPVGEDMDGKPLVSIFADSRQPTVIPSWDSISGPFEDGQHEKHSQVDAASNAEAIKQLVELGYIDAPDDDLAQEVSRTAAELNYNLAQSLIDSLRYQDACEVLEPIWYDHPREHRYGIKYLYCLARLGRWSDRRIALDRFKKNITRARAWASREIDALRKEAEEKGYPSPQETGQEGSQNALSQASSLGDGGEVKSPPQKFIYEMRKAESLLNPMQGTLSFLEFDQLIGEGENERARKVLVSTLSHSSARQTPGFHALIGYCFSRLGECDKSEEYYKLAIESDPKSLEANCGLCKAALERQEWDKAVDLALTATELAFGSPYAHFCLGQALVGTGDLPAGRIALETAIRLEPGLIEAREFYLDVLFRLDDPTAPDERQRIEQIKQRFESSSHVEELDSRSIAGEIAANRKTRRAKLKIDSLQCPPEVEDAPITIVSGLPRSGTSMLMQMLQAGGMKAFTDGRRAADPDNPKGYFEHTSSKLIESDSSWMPLARGSVVKIICQHLPALPRGEHYKVIFMDRNMEAVIESQNAMLDRMGRKGGNLKPEQMMKVLDAHVATAERILARSPHIDAIFVDYDDVIQNPESNVSRIAAFLGAELDTKAMVNAVDPQLRRKGETLHLSCLPSDSQNFGNLM